MYRGDSTQPVGDISWRCAHCGREATGKRVSHRSSVLQFNIATPGTDSTQSQCSGCGYTMCSQCLELQKPSELMPDRETLCPECGKPFGDGALLLPPAHPAYAGIGKQAGGAYAEGTAFNYVRDLKTWAGWLIFWSVVNTGMLIWTLQQTAASLGPGEYIYPTGLGCLIIAIDVTVLISAITCLFSRLPWPGFYIVFAIYLIEIGLLNLTAGEFWTFLGIFQLTISISLFVNWFKYRRAHSEASTNW